MSYIKAGILGGIVLFLWGSISWMVLPWHMTTLNSFKDEKSVTDIIVANVPQSGIYLLPFQQTQAKQAEQAQQPPAQPFFVFAAVSLDKMASTSMVTSMATDFIWQVIATTLVAWLLTKTGGLSYFGRVTFVVVFALAAGITTHVPYWVWFSFNTQYTLIMVADMIIGWFLAGLVLAKVAK